ncbi:diguanylate cyclase [uncultured Brevundimonas sp.]|uniref:diguanylate cyclase n=1 Tax=uncultured Brevundimonas sp. TaxID=213418 RepID=UPI0030EBC765|tara:strand:+ start:4230 stop:6038 length:1809 start_codon:yes stop_codon:yes gene_type:complete
MRLATITNWAYGTTVLLTLASGATAILASNAQEHERGAVAQRYHLDKASSAVGAEVYALTNQARQYVMTGDPGRLIVYRQEAANLSVLENRLRRLHDAGATDDELNVVRAAIRWTDTLTAEQQAAIAARQAGDLELARQIMFGAEYERDLNRVESMITGFQDRLDQRTEVNVAAATDIARLWRTTSEIMLALTGVLFLCVLYFILTRKILRPVIRLSDVVTRLAAQDYDVETPDYGDVDEIGDISQAIRLFRENGLERQRLEAAHHFDQAMRDLLSRMTQRMQGCVNMGDLTEVIARFMPEIFPALAGRVYLLDKTCNALVTACDWSSPQHSQNKFSPTACWALQRGTLHRPAGDSIDVVCAHAISDTTVDTVCVPLTAQRETIGLLYLEPRSEVDHEQGDLPESYLMMLAENIGLALANLRLRDSLQEMAMADPLTGLANRRHLDSILNAEIAKARHSHHPISCLMLDVDHFKRFNDSFGHDAGDAVLGQIGALLSRMTRETGLACRYGGEEFLLLMPGLGPDEALNRAEDIRRQVEALTLVHGEQSLGPITASIGVASAPDHCTMDHLVKTADAAMYRAKKAGRNQVVASVPRRTNNAAA